MPWFWAVVFTRLVAFAGAIVLARRHKEYAPVAWLLGLGVVSDIVRPALSILVLGFGPPGGLPYQGFERLCFHMEQAVFVAWPFGITALALHTLAGRRVWPIAVAYLVAVAGLALGYPTVRRELLQSVYLGVWLAALLVCLVAVYIWWRTEKPTSPPERAALMFFAIEFAAVLGSHAAGLIDKTWPISQGLYVGLYSVLAVLQVLWLRRR